MHNQFIGNLLGLEKSTDEIRGGLAT